MTHIEYYDQTITNLSIIFETRYYLKEFHKLSSDQQSDLLATLNGYMNCRDKDMKALNDPNR